MNNITQIQLEVQGTLLKMRLKYANEVTLPSGVSDVWVQGVKWGYEPITQETKFDPALQKISDVQRKLKRKRGVIKSFSRKSRKRLLELSHRLRASEPAKFLTLTFPEKFPDPKRAKENLKAFLMALKRAIPSVSGVWKLEYQARGAAHFHLILFGLEWLDFEWTRATWERIIKFQPYISARTNKLVENVQIDIKGINNARQMYAYFAKYIAKHVEQLEKTFDVGRDDDGELVFSQYLDTVPYQHEGRFWGYINKKLLPFAELTIIDITDNKQGFLELTRAVGRYKRKYGKRNKMRGAIRRRFFKWRGMTLFTDNPEKWITLYKSLT